MPMRLFLQAEEGGAQSAFLGADTDFNIALTDRDGLPIDLSTGYAVLQLFPENNRGSTLARVLAITPTSGKESSGLGTVSIGSEEAILGRNTYFAWALRDDGSGDSGKINTTVSITSGGAGYEANPTVVVDNTLTLGGTLGAMTATIKGGVKTAVTVSSGGSGYTSAPSITFNTPPGGVAATATATVSGGAVTGITITNAGSGYTVANPPVITIGGPGTGAAATAKINGSVVSITVTNQGTGYKLAPTLSFTPTAGEIPTAATAVASVIRGLCQISQTPSSITIQ